MGAALGVMVVEPLQPEDPRQVGDYRLLGRLGAGGMGQVFLGVSPGGRQVAVKVIHRALALDHNFRTRFRREVAAAGRVSGAFTAPVIDTDPDAPEPWLVTSYVSGPSLEQAVRERGPLPAPRVLELGAGLAEALAAIHDAGVVHRDLKPSNVLLAADGPRVIDFGIAQAAGATSITGAGFVVGSPGFISPEQVVSGEAGPASDVFALGAVLCFAATGSGPFGEGPPHTLLYRAAHAEPALDALGDGRLRALLAACLARDPAQRPTPRQVLGLAGAPHGGYAVAGTGAPPVAEPAVAGPAGLPTAAAVRTTPETVPRAPGGGPATATRAGHRAGTRPRSPARLAAAAGGGALAAAAVLTGVFVWPGAGGHPGPPPASSPAAASQPKPYAFDNSVKQVDSLAAVFPHIKTRAADRAPLTWREVFGRTDREAQPVFGSVVLRLAHGSVDGKCAAAVWGGRLRQELRAAGCTQVARGAYLPLAGERLGGRYMGMFVVFDLRDETAAREVAFSMGPSTVIYDPVTLRTSRGGTAGFVLPPDIAPFSGLGGNQDNEAEAQAMGHFLVVTWAQGSGASASTDGSLSAVEGAAFSPVDVLIGQRDINAAAGG